MSSQASSSRSSHLQVVVHILFLILVVGIWLFSCSTGAIVVRLPVFIRAMVISVIVPAVDSVVESMCHLFEVHGPSPHWSL